MAHLWTIIFVTLVAAAAGLGVWHDREATKRRARREAAYAKRNKRDAD